MPKFSSKEMEVPSHAQGSIDRWQGALDLRRSSVSDGQLMFVLFHLGQEPDGTGAAPNDESIEARLREVMKSGSFEARPSGGRGPAPAPDPRLR